MLYVTAIHYYYFWISYKRRQENSEKFAARRITERTNLPPFDEQHLMQSVVVSKSSEAIGERAATTYAY
jgi:hypothetical protein